MKYRMKIARLLGLILTLCCTAMPVFSQQQDGINDFNQNWKFLPGDDPKDVAENYPDAKWRTLNLPHDWGIDGSFSKSHPATFSGGCAA